MSERQAIYTLPHSGEQRTAAFSLPAPVDLGQHILEVREDHTVVVFLKTGWNSLVQLSKEEAYRLLVTLQWVFQQEMERAETTSTEESRSSTMG